MAGIAQRLLTNIVSSWIGFAVRLVIAFLFVPYITSVLGDARYGVWIILFQIVSYFFLFDIGLEKAMARFVPRFLGLDDHDSLNKVLASATAIYGGVALVTVTAALLAATLLFPQFKISDPSLAADGRTALVIIGLVVALRFFFFPYGGSLGAFHRFDIAKGLEIGEELGRTAVYVILLANGYGLIALAVTLALFALARNIVGVVILKRKFPEVDISLKHVSAPTVRMLLVYSRTAFGIAAVWIVLFNSDSILLGLFAGAALVGVYAPAAQILLYGRNIVNALAIPLMPALVHLESTRSLDSVRELYVKALRIVSYFSMLLAIGIWFFGGDFVRLWLPAEFADTRIVLWILAGGAVFFLPQIIGNTVLFALEKHGSLLLLLIVETLLKLGLAAGGLYALAHFGKTFVSSSSFPEELMVMATATVLPQALLYPTVYPLLMKRALGMRYRSVMHTWGVSAALSMCVAMPIAALMKSKVPPSSWPTFFLDVAIVTAVALVPFFIFVLESDDRSRLRAWLRGK